MGITSAVAPVQVALGETVERFMGNGAFRHKKIGVPTYRFCTRAPDGSIAASCEMEVPSEQEACEIAYNLIVQEAYTNMEVWRGNTKIYALPANERQGGVH